MPHPDKNPIQENMETVRLDQARQIEGVRQGQPALYTCPDCGGVLWQTTEPEMVLFRCHTGHIVAGEHLFLDQLTAAENALWTAIRTLEDRLILGRQLARFAAGRNDSEGARLYERLAKKSEKKYLSLLKIAETGDDDEVES